MCVTALCCKMSRCQTQDGGSGDERGVRVKEEEREQKKICVVVTQMNILLLLPPPVRADSIVGEQ